MLCISRRKQHSQLIVTGLGLQLPQRNDSVKANAVPIQERNQILPIFTDVTAYDAVTHDIVPMAIQLGRITAFFEQETDSGIGGTLATQAL